MILLFLCTTGFLFIAVILSWFVDKDVMDRAVKLHQLVEEDEVECKISDAVVDENVDVCLIRKYFTTEAWMIVEDVVKLKSDKIVHSCHHDLHSEQSIYSM